MRLLSLLGTRPEIIRLACILRRLDETTEHRLAYTGQSFDASLSTIFFRQLGVREPDYQFNAAGASLGDFLARLFPAVESALDDFRPDAVLTLGDTNSALGVILAMRRGLPVYHLEAGNRSFDQRVPEEMNRRMLDHLCSFNLAYTEHARRNLLAEGLPSRACAVIGSPLREVFDAYRDMVDDEKILSERGLDPGGYIVLSVHREENVVNTTGIGGILDGVGALADELDVPIVVSAHPRFRQSTVGRAFSPRWRLCEPFGYFEYVALQRQSALVVSDSGSVGEEAAILGFCAVTPRSSMERPEALETGSIMLTGTRADDVHRIGRMAIEAYTNPKTRPHCPDDYTIPDTSERVARFVLSTEPVSAFWSGRTGP